MIRSHVFITFTHACKCVQHRTRGQISRSLATSFVRGPTDPPLLLETLPELFANRLLREHSSKTALISAHEGPRPHGGPLMASSAKSRYLTWNYEHMDKHVAALARGMVDIGVKRGDRVGVIMGNCRYLFWLSSSVFTLNSS